MVILVVIVLRPSHSLNAQSEVGMKQVRPVVPISQAQWEGVADSLEVQMHQTVHSLAAAEVVEASSPASESFIPPVRMDAVQLDQIPASSRIAALAATAGVDMVSAGAGMLRPVLRGLSGLRIATLFNGARIESQAWGEYHGIYIPEEGIERVEIIRGPGTLAPRIRCIRRRVELCSQSSASGARQEKPGELEWVFGHEWLAGHRSNGETQSIHVS